MPTELWTQSTSAEKKHDYFFDNTFVIRLSLLYDYHRNSITTLTVVQLTLTSCDYESRHHRKFSVSLSWKYQYVQFLDHPRRSPWWAVFSLPMA